MMARTLKQLFMEALERHMDKPAIIEDTGSARSSLSYGDLWDASRKVSQIIAERNDKAGRRSQFVGVCMDQSLVYPAVILGILDQDLSFACVDPSWPLGKQYDYLKKLGALLLIHDNPERRLDEKDCQICECLQDRPIYFLQIQSLENIGQECSHSMAYAILTSGSTGHPKVVRVPHASILPNVVDVVRLCKVTSEDVIFLSSPSTFDPSVVDIFVALSSGACLLVTSTSVKASSARLLHVLFPVNGSHAVSFLQMTPSIFNRWSERELQEVVLGSATSLRVLILGGEPFPSLSKLRRCRGDCNQTLIYNIYGITEVSSWASMHQILFPSSETGDHLACDKEQVQLGQPLSDTLLQVRDIDTGSTIEVGCGEMFIGSFSRICEVNDERCSDYCPPVYRGSGDIVQLHPDGKLCYIGRKDHIIKRWGHRVSLEKVEWIAESHPAVKAACCVWDEAKHKLFLVVALSVPEPTLALRRHFLTFKGSDSVLWPDEIIPVEDISLTFHGKVNRLSVVESLLNRRIAPPNPTSISRIFLKLWCEVLGIQCMKNLEASFLELGGTSLLAVILMTELEQKFGKIPQDLANLLLSGETFQLICEKLGQFYSLSKEHSKQIMSIVQDEHCNALRLSEMVDDKTDETVLKDDALVFFSQRGQSSIGNTILMLPEIPTESIGMKLSWKVNLGKCIDASPLLLVYKSGHCGVVIGSHSGKFVFLDGCSGLPAWSLTLPDRIESSAYPSVCGKHIFVGCYDGILYCVSALSGTVTWTFPTEGMIKCTPVTCNNGKSVIFGSYDYKIYCVNSETGSLQWSSYVFESDSKRGSWQASPVIVNDVAIVCSLTCKVAALQTTDGRIMWSVTFQSPIFSTPCVYSLDSGAHVIIAEVLGTVHCLSICQGEEVWSWEAAGHIFAPLSLVKNISLNEVNFSLLVGCYDFHLYSLTISAHNRTKLKWRVNLNARVASAPFPFSMKTLDAVERLYATVGISSGYVLIINLADGNICCKYEANSEVFSSSVVFEDKVYFGCRDDNVYCLEIGKK